MQRSKHVVAVEGTERAANGDVPSASCIYKSAAASEPKTPTTLYETFTASVKAYPNNDCECVCGERERGKLRGMQAQVTGSLLSVLLPVSLSSQHSSVHIHSHTGLGSREKGADGKVGGFKWLSYARVAEIVGQLASGMIAAGVQPKERVGVFGANSPSWMMAMQVGTGLKHSNTHTSICLPQTHEAPKRVVGQLRQR